MKTIHPLRHKKSSISMPDVTFRRLQAAKLVFLRNGINFSMQEIYRRLFKLFLAHWRGRGLKTNGLRRYGRSGRDYAIHPLCVNQVLHAALWQRAIHSGESISRMLDIAVRLYLPRLLEELLQGEGNSPRGARNANYWGQRYARRKKKCPAFFINYVCQTEKNDSTGLAFAHKTQIIPKKGMSPMEIIEIMLKAT